ncbi:unnamed protein product, partial [marine sediment metagenome]
GVVHSGKYARIIVICLKLKIPGLKSQIIISIKGKGSIYQY